LKTPKRFVHDLSVSRKIATHENEDKSSKALAYTIGILHCQRLANQTIAAQLGMRPAEVGEIIGKLYDQGRIRRTLDIEDLDEDTLAQIGDTQCESCLQQYLNDWSESTVQPGACALRRVCIVPVEPDADSPEGWTRKLTRFGAGAANEIVKQVEGFKGERLKVGCAWGETINKTITPLALHPAWRKGDGRDRICVAMTGELTWLSETGPRHLSSSAHAETLAARAENCTAITLRGIPAYISMKESDSFVSSYKRYLAESNWSYGQFEALGRDLDGIITSLGNMEQQNKLWPQALKDEGLGEELLKKLEDIGGVILSRDKLAEDELKAIRKLENRWLGLKREHYAACARRTPGVIAVAAGKGKLGTTLRAVASGLISVLIVDRELARSIGEYLLAWDAGRSRPGTGPHRYAGGDCPPTCRLGCAWHGGRRPRA
jgi:DNA-binding transcriptional regulator LsrR (DeoR family)